MPGPHRRFLQELSRQANVRSYAMEHATDSPVREAYNAAVLTLCSFRDAHIRLVSRYIILASKKTAVSKQTSEQAPVNLATTSGSASNGSHTDDEFHGTGGTDLVPFLKQTRDTTRAAARC